jgi:SH3 domain protein
MRSETWFVSRLQIACAALLACAVPDGVSAADQAWVKGEARYNLRRAPGAEYRIVGLVKSGDTLIVLERVDGWTKVQTEDGGEEGWIDSEHLLTDPPPAVRVTELESQIVELRGRIDDQCKATAELRSENEELSQRSNGQETEIARLTGHNQALRAEARWREWLTGGSILIAGMLLGMLMHRSATRRASTRLRF